MADARRSLHCSCSVPLDGCLLLRTALGSDRSVAEAYNAAALTCLFPTA